MISLVDRWIHRNQLVVDKKLYKALTNALEIPPTSQQLQIFQQQQQQQQQQIEQQMRQRAEAAAAATGNSLSAPEKHHSRRKKMPAITPVVMSNGKQVDGHHAHFLHPDIAAVLYPEIMAKAAKTREMAAVATVQTQPPQPQSDKQSDKQLVTPDNPLADNKSRGKQPQTQTQSKKKNGGVVIITSTKNGGGAAKSPKSVIGKPVAVKTSSAAPASEVRGVGGGNNNRTKDFLKKKSVTVVPPATAMNMKKKLAAQQKQLLLQQQLANRPPPYLPRILHIEGGGLESSRPEWQVEQIAKEPIKSVYVNQFVPPKLKTVERQITASEIKRSLYGSTVANNGGNRQSALSAAASRQRGGNRRNSAATVSVNAADTQLRPDSSGTQNFSNQSSTLSLQAQHRFPPK